MRRLLLGLAIFALLLSCDKNKVDNIVLVYSMKEDLPDDYFLNSKEQGTSIDYQYQRKLDTIRKLNFNFLKENHVLLLGEDTLKVIPTSFKPKNMEFKMYQKIENKNDATTYIFHEDYGLLARLGFRSHQIFVKDSLTSLEKENIFKGLFIELNKIYIK